MRRSVWFNKELFARDTELRARVGLITRTMDQAVESRLGYSTIET